MVRCIDLTLRSKEKSQVVLRAIQYGAVVYEAGGIEQDVDLAGALGQGGDGRAVTDVEPGYFRDALALECGKLGLVNVGGEHRCAFTRKGDCAGAADSGGGGGDKGALALQAV